MAFIEARGLRKTYVPKGAPPVHALDGLDLTIEQGTIRGLLGPNGAGKTTTVKVFTTLIQPDEGSVTIDGIDVLANPEELRPRIGVSGQYAAVDENLTGFENLEMVGRLYHLGAKAARARAHELIELFDLVEAANRPVKGFSGGMRRRIDLAGALVASPRVLFLDEPTTGLDPRSRLGLWDVIAGLKANGTTILLTTQYLEEADQLADNISVIDTGRVIAEGTADELKAQVGGQRIEVNLVNEADHDAAEAILARVAAHPIEASADRRKLTVKSDDAAANLAEVLAALAAARIELFDAGMRRPTLDDVFLLLTGHAAEDEQPEPQPTPKKRGRA
ncbi:MAG TPA: ATP-binding cassette domain-containing protein [Microbacteriaceae bacterium]|nr:ATP-binding cassette domain-containing protein [Microbacteriaceae bacterium]